MRPCCEAREVFCFASGSGAGVGTVDGTVGCAPAAGMVAAGERTTNVQGSDEG
jgi:hypothetical protein